MRAYSNAKSIFYCQCWVIKKLEQNQIRNDDLRVILKGYALSCLHFLFHWIISKKKYIWSIFYSKIPSTFPIWKAAAQFPMKLEKKMTLKNLLAIQYIKKLFNIISLRCLIIRLPCSKMCLQPVSDNCLLHVSDNLNV